MNNKLSNLLLLTLVFLSLLILAYTFYRSEIVYKGTHFQYYLKYYLFSISLISFFIILFFIKKEVKNNLLIIIFGFIFSLYLLEFILSFLLLVNPYSIERKIFNRNYDTRSIEEVIEYKKKENANIFPTIKKERIISKKTGKEIVSLSPGLSKEITILCNETGNWVTYKSDRYGFNNLDSEWDNETEFLLIGDSYTHGLCISSKENIAGQIKEITNKNIINLGVEGTGPLRQLGVLKEYGASKKPKNLIWLYFEGNDLQELDTELNNKVLVKYLEKSFTQSLLDHQEEINNFKVERFNFLISKRDDLIYKIRFVRLYELRKFVKRYLDNYNYRKNIEANINFYFDFNSSVFPYFKDIITEAKDLTESWGGNFLFVYIPEYARYHTKIDSPSTFRNKKKIIEFLKNKNISTLDLDKKLFKNEKNYNLSYLGPVDHLTSFGYKKIAELIVNQAVKD